MRKTTLVIDDELVAQAQAALGTTGLKETIDAALLEVVKARARLDHVKRLQTMEGLDLDKPEIMDEAWR